jgi:hypothetical protein
MVTLFGAFGTAGAERTEAEVIAAAHGRPRCGATLRCPPCAVFEGVSDVRRLPRDRLTLPGRLRTELGRTLADGYSMTWTKSRTIGTGTLRERAWSEDPVDLVVIAVDEPSPRLPPSSQPLANQPSSHSAGSSTGRSSPDGNRRGTSTIRMTTVAMPAINRPRNTAWADACSASRRKAAAAGSS